MDPLSALSIAASTVQFVDFGCRLFSDAKELYHSGDGALIGHHQAEDAAVHLGELTEGLKASLCAKWGGKSVPGEEALEAICTGCIEVSKQLCSLLQSLRTDNRARYRRWESFRKAFLIVRSRREVEAISLRLQQYSEQLRTHVLVSVSQRFEQLSLSNNEELQGLDRELRSQLRDLFDILDDIKTRIDDKALSIGQELDDTTNRTLLASLRFQSMDIRYEEVCDAHKDTFRWVFQSDKSPQPQKWPSFSDWLTGDGRMFWLSGKPGSGKSTLMRYIYGHDETTRLLRKWSPNICVAKYFFWSCGTKEQRSQVGLLRCLLFEILDQRRDLIQQVFPDKWERARSLSLQSQDLEMWSLPALKCAFARLTRIATERDRMCFFVDGLDECEGSEESGDHRSMGEYLVSVTSAHVKICVSSRPLHVFTDILNQFPGLRLQDVTASDIRAYVTAELVQNGRMKAPQYLEPGSPRDFIDEIVVRAEGVFLWVTLVLKSIVNGIGRHETISQLKLRLRRLPSDLTSLYDHMFRRMDSGDMQKAAQIIQLFEASGYHAAVMRLGFALEATYEEAISNTWKEWDGTDLVSLQKRTTAAIESTCAGFIEIRHGRSSIDPCAVGNEVWSNDELLLKYIRGLASSRLYYIHRTVREYLWKDEIQEKLISLTGSIQNFNPVLSNLMAAVALTKALPAIWHQKTVLKPGYLDVYARELGWKSEFGWRPSNQRSWGWDHSTQSRMNRLLNVLFRLQYSVIRYGKASLDDSEFVDNIPDHEAGKLEAEYFSGAITCGCTSWAMQRVRTIKRFPESDRSILSSAFGGGMITHQLPLHFHLLFKPDLLEFVRFLLQHGANVNDAWSADEPSRSIWAVVLVSLDNDLSDTSYLLSNEELELRVQYMSAFLEYGADTEAELEVPYINDMGIEDHYVVSVQSVLTRLEDQEVPGTKEVRDLFETHRVTQWKNTERTRYREGGFSMSRKRVRETRYEEKYRREARPRRGNHDISRRT